MQMNTSSTGGPLKATNNVVEGQSYEALIKEFLIGLTGVPEQYVIPEKKLSTNDKPDTNDHWISFFMQHRVAENSPYLKNINEDEVLLQRSFTDVWLITFHGGDHQSISERFEDAIYIYQNRDVLKKMGVSVKEAATRNQDLQIASVDFNHEKTEVQLVLNREVKRVYKIENFINSILSF